MTKNPIINALSGLSYITLVVSLIYFSPRSIDQVGSIFLPIAMLSLFVLSASCMGYLFLYQPLQLFLEGDKRTAVNLFLKTIGTFAISAAILVLIGLYLTGSFQ